MSLDTVWLATVPTISFFFGFAFARVLDRLRQLPTQEGWVTLPSGMVYATADEMVGYITKLSTGKFHWWVTREHKTVIEGPAETLGDAQREAVRAVMEFRRVEHD